MAKRKPTPLFNDRNFFYFVLLVFIFISSSALYLSGDRIFKANLLSAMAEKVKYRFSPLQLAPLPQLKSTVSSFPIISAQAALAIDLDSRISLYEKNPDQKLLPASTTKIMTALVAMDAFRDSDVLEVNGISAPGQRMNLMKGEKITAGDLFKGLLVYSANDAAEVLADNYPGRKEAFVAAMNQKARELNLSNTFFENPTGYDGSEHVSCARDLILVAEIAMQNPRFANLVKIDKTTVTSVDGKIIHHLTNTNKLLGQDGIVGVKTGWTQNARENLVTYLNKDGRRIIIAVLGSQDRFGETKELINWIFENYEWRSVDLNEKSN